MVTMTKQASPAAGQSGDRSSDQSGTPCGRSSVHVPEWVSLRSRGEAGRREGPPEEVWPPPPLAPGMDRDSHTEDTLSTMVLENIKNKLIHAFRAAGESREQPPGVRPVSSFQANEELRRAQIDGAITWLRSELLEMRSQDLQLAQTLLGLNTEIQRLRRESSGFVDVDGEEQQ